MAGNTSGQQSGGNNESWLDRAIDIVKPLPEPPPKPTPPRVNQKAWNESVEETHIIPGLTVHDVGLSVFGETRSLHDRPGSNEPIDAARQKVAHVIINGAEKWGPDRTKYASTAPPIEPSKEERDNPVAHAAYESSMRAAREAFLSGHDPTAGALYLNMRTTPDRSNLKFKGGNAQGVPMTTQSGPYYNSFPNREVPSRTAWVNTYRPDEDEDERP